MILIFSHTDPFIVVNNKRNVNMAQRATGLTGLWSMGFSAVFRLRGKSLQLGVVLLCLGQFIQMGYSNVHYEIVHPTWIYIMIYISEIITSARGGGGVTFCAQFILYVSFYMHDIEIKLELELELGLWVLRGYEHQIDCCLSALLTGPGQLSQYLRCISGTFIHWID